ncbi:unnamed protein product [Strongylus vulgaris]|uniref:Uncharacterized protein n=1 Tax=Strongylus vulgaris TaxID=40348 RepID=A0A3P7JE38_STRVU|nr:unnamed protein product [Strongylus vulgaris]
MLRHRRHESIKIRVMHPAAGLQGVKEVTLPQGDSRRRVSSGGRRRLEEAVRRRLQVRTGKMHEEQNKANLEGATSSSLQEKVTSFIPLYFCLQFQPHRNWRQKSIGWLRKDDFCSRTLRMGCASNSRQEEKRKDLFMCGLLDRTKRCIAAASAPVAHC